MLDLLRQVSVRHAVIRRRSEYRTGDDIDILCDNKLEMANQLIYLAKHLIAEGVDVRLARADDHIHLDFLRGGVLQTRFDLIDSLDVYKEQVYRGDEAADVALRLLEYAKHPEKVKHLDYARASSIFQR